MRDEPIRHAAIGGMSGCEQVQALVTVTNKGSLDLAPARILLVSTRCYIPTVSCDTAIDNAHDRQCMLTANRSIDQILHHLSQLGMSFIPQELIDEIIGHVLSCNCDEQNQQSLRNCSLVAKSWTHPSRRRLFAIVEIRKTTFQSWLDTITPANTEVLRHVRSLSYITTAAPGSCHREPEHRVDVLRDYLPSFHRLQHLSLSSMHIPSSDISQQIEIFSAFRHSLSRLSLQYCTVTINALVALINFFPGLDRLDLCYITHEADGESAPPLCRSLIQKLHIPQFHEDSLDILDQLSELGLVFEELIVGRWSSKIGLHVLSHIVNSLGVNIKRFRLMWWETRRKCRKCMYITRTHYETC